jgi:ribosomal protein S18 acetylase RimI-like enzyme
MNLELQSVLDYGLERTVDLLNLGFSDYVVPIQSDFSSLLHMVSQDSVDLESSQVVLREGQAVGVALIARRGWTSRLAAMSIIPSARGAGAGSWLMSQLLDRARARHERAMVLEVIQGNEAALRLYRRCGFQTVRRLASYTASPTAAPADAGNPDTEVDERLGSKVDVRELARLVSAYGLPDLPWQISGESLAHQGPPSLAYQLEGAYITISNPQAEQVAVRALLVLPAVRGQGRAIRLLRSTMARYPHKTWRVPAFCPEEMGGLFERAGFTQGSLSQFQMRLEWG